MILYKDYRVTKKALRDSNRCYSPDENLLKLIKGLKQVELDRVELDRDIKSKRLTGKEAEKRKKSLNTARGNFGVLKKRVLDNVIFPAMASLTYLLEQMNDDPAIRKRFDDDIKALFLTKSKVAPTEDQRKVPIFTRFIISASRSRLPKENEPIKSLPPLPDFRSLLWNIMQASVTLAMREAAPHIFSEKFNDSGFSFQTMKPQLESANSWSRLFAMGAYRQYMPLGKETRPALF